MNDSTYVPARERSSFGQFQLRPSHLTTTIPGAAQFGPAVVVVAPEVVRAASLTVCAHARDADDARCLLAQLGLDQ